MGTLDFKQVEVPGPKVKAKKERDIIGIDHRNSNQLCFFKSEADLEDGSITLSRKILYEHPKITMYNNLLDAHFYIVEKWVCDFVKAEQRITTIKGELIPYLVKKQFSVTSKDIIKCDNLEVDDTPNPKLNNLNGDAVSDFIGRDDMISNVQDFSSWNDHSSSLKSAYMDRPLRCYGFLMDKGQGICLRANNLHAYIELNRKIERILPSVAPNMEMCLLHATSEVHSKSQIGEECLVGEDSKISEKTTLKNCIIGNQCVVEPKVRLTNCILMNKVTVKSGGNIQGSLVCDNATIGEKCDMKDSIVGVGKRVESEGEYRNEVIAIDDSEMMEI